jgi:hypothetical protein
MSYYENNKERVKARTKAYYETNKEAMLQRNREWKKNNPEKFKASQDKWLKKNPLYSYYHNAKRRAAERKIPFDLHYTDLDLPEICAISGVKLTRGSHEGAASLDCVIPHLGYVKGNVQWITKRLNRIKQEGSALEHRMIADYIDKYSD